MLGLTPFLVLSFAVVLGQVRGQCSIPEEQRETLNQLLQTMLWAAKDTSLPNPSVLLALRLARDHNIELERQLVNRLKKYAVRTLQGRQEFPSGLIALYTLALKSACENPQHIDSDGVTVNLLQKLREEFLLEIDHINRTASPLTNYYQIGLDVLALCINGQPLTPPMINVLSDAVQRNLFTHGNQFSVDTGAISILALFCVHISDPDFLVEPILLSLQRLQKQILSAVTSDGLIGNLYSTGLGVQALSVIHHLVPDGSWNCSLSLKRLLVDPSALANPQAASQVTPSLEGRTYLDVGNMDCRGDVSNLTLLEPSEHPPTTVEMPFITVSYNVTDGVGGTFSDVTLVSVPRGSSLLRVMEEAREIGPLRFSFQLETTLWGSYVTSVRGLRSSSKSRTYWKLLSGDRALDQGVTDYTPSDGEMIIMILSHY